MVPRSDMSRSRGSPAAHHRRERFRVHGVDFSGARDAGRKVWVASGTIDGAVLRVEDCRRGESLPGGGKDRARCLQALVEFIESERAVAVGLDFPFGIPGDLVEDDSWEGFIAGFAARYDTPEDFKESCFQATRGAELKRRTDRECHTPFSAYNLRLYKQTFFGIRDVLRPLVTEGKVRVLPMQKPEPGLPWLLEVCPASTLRFRALRARYKKQTPQHRKARHHILKALQTDMEIPGEVIDAALEDHRGDAIDSIIAAQVTARALASVTDPLLDGHDYMLEGQVYV